MRPMKKAREESRAPLDVWELSRHLTGTLEPVLSTALLNKIRGAIRNRSVAGLLENLEVPLSEPHLHSSDSYYTLLQLKALFSKNDSLGRPDDGVAIAGLLSDEAYNAETNKRLDSRDFSPEEELFCWKFGRAFDYAIGDTDDLIDRLPEEIVFTSGATRHLPRSRSHAHRKVRKKIEAPSLASPLVTAFSRYIGCELEHVPCDSNRLVVVPKNYKTGRTIACEPSGALPLQLAIDCVLKKRLRRIGQNLSDQHRNAELARRGSITDDISTIDLKSASNSTTCGLIRLLADFSPNVRRFCDLLQRLRARDWVFQSKSGETISGTYEMFSSMGNGFTFPLETLIFWSVASAIDAQVISIYGDDCIVESTKAAEMIRWLGFIGYRVNEEKTFITGPFRESCGGNFFRGVDVTPVYIRGKLNGPLTCHVLNSFAQRWDLLSDELQGYLEAYADSRQDLPRVTPDQPTWAGLFIPLWEACKRRLIKSQASQHTIKGFTLRTRGLKKACGIQGYILWLIRHSGEARPVDELDDVALLYQFGRSEVAWRVRKRVALAGNSQGRPGPW